MDKNGLSVLSARDEWGYTPAHWAALDGNIEVSFRSSLNSGKEKLLFHSMICSAIGNEILDREERTSRSFLSGNARA